MLASYLQFLLAIGFCARFAFLFNPGDDKTVKFKCAKDALQFLQGQISTEKFKLRVISECALAEVIGFFKDPDSDMNLKMTVTFN